MYTRCPECQTTFRITVAQLKARDGTVRCGKCDTIFRADLRLFSPAETTSDDDIEEIELETPTTAPPSGDETGVDTDIPTVSELTLFVPPQRTAASIVWVAGAVVAAILLLGQFTYFYRNELA